MKKFHKAMEIIRFKTSDLDKLQLAISCLIFIAVHQSSGVFDDMVLKT